MNRPEACPTDYQLFEAAQVFFAVLVEAMEFTQSTEPFTKVSENDMQEICTHLSNCEHCEEWFYEVLNYHVRKFDAARPSADAARPSSDTDPYHTDILIRVEPATACPTDDELLELTGDTPPSDWSSNLAALELSSHLAACERCSSRYADLESTLAAAAELAALNIQPPPVPEEFLSSVGQSALEAFEIARKGAKTEEQAEAEIVIERLRAKKERYQDSVDRKIRDFRLLPNEESTKEEPEGSFTKSAEHRGLRAFMARRFAPQESALESSTASQIVLGSEETAHGRVNRIQENWHRKLEGLPQQDRKIIELCAAGYTCKEVAEEVGINESTIRQILNDVKRRISESESE